MDIIKKETRKVTSVEQVPTLLANDERLKDPTNAANAFNNCLTRINEKLNIQQREKGDAISISWKLPLHKNNPNYWNWDKEYHTFPKCTPPPPKKSSGYYEITRKILQACASLISHPLSYIYNHLLYTCIFPDSLKIAVVQPLYKKSDKTSMTNYRPIPLLRVFIKVLEKVVHSRWSQHLHTNNILVTEQYSFRKGITTEDAAFRLTDSVFKSINQKTLEEFSVIWQRLLSAWITKFC